MWRKNACPEAHALRSALDEAGDVGHDEARLADLDDAQIRRQRREVVVGDLRPRRRDDGQDRRLADVREAHQPDVRDGLQLQRDLDGLALLAGLGELRRLPRRRGEMRVAEAAAPAADEDAPDARLVQVEQQLARRALAHDRSRRHFDHDVRARAPRPAAGRAVHAVFGGELAVVAEVHQRVHPVGRQKPRRRRRGRRRRRRAQPACNELFAVKRHAAVAAVARLDGDVHHVYK